MAAQLYRARRGHRQTVDPSQLADVAVRIGEAVERAGEQALRDAIAAGDADIGESAISETHTATDYDSSISHTTGALTHRAWVKYLFDKHKTKTITHIFTDIDTARATLDAGVHYIDMATSLSVPDKRRPYTVPGKMLGDYQVAKSGLWEAKGKIALIGMGMDPGLSNIFAAYAKKWTVDEVSAVHIRDGGDLRIEGYPFATVFSLWTVIEECLNPPIVWRNGAIEVRAPFSEPEDFVFPEGIGPVMCVNVEHEEVVQLPRTIPAELITFKYALGADFIETLRLLHRLGLDGKNPIDVKGVKVAPRDVIASLSPDPSTLGKNMVGRAIVGTLVSGTKDHRPRETFHYQVCDAAETMGRYNLQPVAWQTGVMPIMAMELIAEGVWNGAGVKSPDAFDPDPFLDLCEDYDVTVKLEHRIPGRSILPATESVPAGARSVTVKGSSTPTDPAYAAAAQAALRGVDEER